MDSTFDIGGERTVHRLGYGAMQLLGEGRWGPPEDPENAIAVLRRAVDLGVDLIDTADAYGPAVSEDQIRAALHPYDGLTIATKGGFLRTGPWKWVECGYPPYLRQCAEMSLRRLGVECIDLYQLHRVDPAYPLEDQVGLLRELVDEGKVRYVGLSEVSVEQLRAAQQVMPIATVQNRYNLVARDSEELLEVCTAEGIGFLPWHPVDSGELAAPDGPLTALARDTGHSPAQLALAWLLRRSPVVLPIPGTASLAHLEENCAAAAVQLDDATYEALSALG